MSDHPNLAAALVAALKDLSVVDKGRLAKIEMKGGGNYTYEYADLGDVVKLTRPKLAEHGIVALTPVEEHGDGLKCTVVLLHSSGERLDFGPFPFPHGQTAQATGSMVTYYRRYALVAALGMAAGDDDDGASAAPRHANANAANAATAVAVGDVGAMAPRDVVAALKARDLPCGGAPEELRERLRIAVSNEAPAEAVAS